MVVSGTPAQLWAGSVRNDSQTVYPEDGHPWPDGGVNFLAYIHQTSGINLMQPENTTNISPV